MPSAADVFRFVTVRAPQRQIEIRSRAPLQYGEPDLKPPLHGRLLALKSEPDGPRRIREEAARYLASERYVGAATNQATFHQLESAYTAGRSAVRRGEPVSEAVEGALGRPLADFAAALGDTGERIWESMYAAYASGRTPPADLERQVTLARAVAVIRSLASEGDLAQVGPLLRGAPTLPRDLFPISQARVAGTGAGERERRAKLRERVKALKLEVWQRASSLQSAWQRIATLPADESKGRCGTPGGLSWRQIAELPAEVRASLDKEGIRLDQPLAALRAAIDRCRASLLARISVDPRRPYAAAARILKDRDAGDLVRLELGEELVYRALDYEVLWTAVPALLPDLAAGAERVEWPAEGEVPVRPVGIADLRVVRQTLQRYQLGEVAHIENVLEGETRERSHRRLHRLEETVALETERVEESERNLQSTERFELQLESERTIQSQQELEAGVTVTASYGPVSIAANAGYSSSDATEESQRSASNYAKEVIDQARQRVEQRVRQQRSRVTIEELEEINKHAFQNTAGDGSVVGIYRWVEKVYQAQIFNYGKRLMFEFMVPEPAAFYRYARETGGVDADLKPPPPLDFQPDYLDAGTYMGKVALYDVPGVAPPPADTVVVGTTFGGESEGKDTRHFVTSKELKIPPGYKAKQGWYRIPGTGINPDPSWWVNLLIGNNTVLSVSAAGGTETRSPFGMNSETDVLPIALSCGGLAGYVVTVEVECEPTDEFIDQWKLQTYEKIAEQYAALLADYEEKLERRKELAGRNPDARPPQRNREIEQDELKRQCVSLLSNQHFDSFDAMRDNQSPWGYPQLDVGESLKEGKIIRFFEHAFEWNQMTYVFYPYFWGRKENWPETLGQDDSDPLFAKFLRAGAARVVAPVRPGFVKAVLNYLELGPGALLAGGEQPVLQDDTYLAIVDEIAEEMDDIGGGVPDSEPWQVVVPTVLVKLQLAGENDIGLSGTD